MDYEWYIVKVQSGHEKKFCDIIRGRSIDLKMKDFFHDVFIPYEEEVKIKNNKKVTKSKSLPGYVFLNMKLCDDSINFIKAIFKKCTFISNGSGDLKSISNDEIEVMKKRILLQNEEKRDDDSILSLKKGDEVKIKKGFFKDIKKGIVKGFVKNGKSNDKNGVIVEICIFDQPLDIEFKLDYVEKKLNDEE